MMNFDVEESLGNRRARQNQVGVEKSHHVTPTVHELANHFLVNELTTSVCPSFTMVEDSQM